MQCHLEQNGRDNEATRPPQMRKHFHLARILLTENKRLSLEHDVPPELMQIFPVAECAQVTGLTGREPALLL
jgi:hypothetical protein